MKENLRKDELIDADDLLLPISKDRNKNIELMNSYYGLKHNELIQKQFKSLFKPKELRIFTFIIIPILSFIVGILLTIFIMRFIL